MKYELTKALARPAGYARPASINGTLNYNTFQIKLDSHSSAVDDDTFLCNTEAEVSFDYVIG